jgi:hypothetical protein
MNTKTVFDQLVVASTTELFQRRGIEVELGTAAAASVEYAGTMGFAADSMRGMIGLGMSPSTLQDLVVNDCQAGPGVNCEDWLAESVNQLLGRLKNKLMPYGVVLSPALPTVLRGVRLEFLGRASTLWTYSLESPFGSLWVWLDVRHEGELVLVASEDPELKGTPEGELLLF